jgi:ribosomal protein S27AE
LELICVFHREFPFFVKLYIQEEYEGWNNAMLEGKCPKCGYLVFGWALHEQKFQLCPKCNIQLKITEDGDRAFKGYSLFTREGYPIEPPSHVPNALDKNN